MRLDEFISILSNLNNGSVIYLNDDSETEVVLGEPTVKLYNLNHKYYFLSEYQDNFSDIESIIRNNQIQKKIKNIRPNNSYLILFYKIEKFTDAISKKIIQLEENEYFYKKYVFYYTEEEFVTFAEWIGARNIKTLSDILKNEDCAPASDKLHIQFLLRLIIKTPFLNLEFKKIELENFDNLLSIQLDGLRKNKVEIKQLFEQLTDDLEKFSCEDIAGRLYAEIIGGVERENTID